MRKTSLVGSLAMGTLALLVATAAKAQVSVPPGSRNPAILNGTFVFSFLGGYDVQDEGHTKAGTGSITFDGRGNISGGVIHCNDNQTEYNSTITGGKYSVNLDGTGFAAVVTATKVCDGDGNGIDLQLTVGAGGSRLRFATDASDLNTDDGQKIVIAGEGEPL